MEYIQSWRRKNYRCPLGHKKTIIKKLNDYLKFACEQIINGEVINALHQIGC